MYCDPRKYRVVFTAVTFCLFAISISDAYMAQIPRVKTINGNCIHPMFNMKIPGDESFHPKDVCERHTCNYAKKAITIYGCGTVMTPTGCHAETDLTKKYPDCCMPKIVCP